MDSLIAFLITAAVLGIFVSRYLAKMKQAEARAQVAAEKANLRSDGPRAQHPHIDVEYCIGCAACVPVCPEGDVLGIVGGKAAIVNGTKCIGHGLCAEVCPVGAITMVMASPAMSADLPQLTPQYESTVKNLFIAGELGGLALIKNAIAQGRDCVDTIASRVIELRAARQCTDAVDLAIIGAGPAGISASLKAIERKLNYVTIDEGEIGGTVAKYPRQKLVMTSPVEFPMYGKFRKTELSKEELLAFWAQVLRRVDFKCRTREKVADVKKDASGIFIVSTNKGQIRARAVILAMGRGGSPRKLGVKGEELPKVMYRLIEADHYVNKKILVVGGGDSAVEAAMGLAHQAGNQVTLSYRKESFSRIKERNSHRIAECMRTGKLKVLFNSNLIEFKPNSLVIGVNGISQEISNDYVWIFAGGEPPTAFLKKIGVGFGMRNVTTEASNEARQAKRARQNGSMLVESELGS
jgi:thioredoxin reductase/Pyruvate/2-oxoacid:ferredoxin oxidoreductase delta subunit